jgi:DNA-binding Lrp family transcriptional regulator
MDSKDRELIRLLQANARATTTSLAAELGLSRATVQSRMARLEAQGIIRGYTLRLAYEVEQRQIRAHVMISVFPKQNAEVSAALVKQAGVRALYAISGEYDLIAIIAAETTEEIDQIIDAIGRLDGVERTNSSIVLSTKFQR